MPPQLSAYQEDLSLVHYLDTVGDSTTGCYSNCTTTGCYSNYYGCYSNWIVLHVLN